MYTGQYSSDKQGWYVEKINNYIKHAFGHIKLKKTAQEHSISTKLVDME